VVVRLMPTEGWYRDNMPPYKAAFEDDTITVPLDDNVLLDHRAIKLVRGVPRVPEGKTSEGRHGDACDGLRVPARGVADGLLPIEYMSGGPRDSSQSLSDFIYG
jgi:phage FluMu gp28-like protein